MPSERAVLDLVGLTYDAAGDATRWPVFLGRLGSVIQSPIANFYAWDAEHVHGSVAVIIGIDADGLRQHTEYYNERNIFMLRGAHLLTPGAVRDADELCPEDELVKSEYYHDYMVPRRLRYGMNAVVFRDSSVTASLGLIRLSSAKPYGEEERELLRILLPHLQRAVQLYQRITGLEVQAKAASTALDCWSLGVILLDAQGRVTLANRSAETILNQSDGLTLAPDGLHARGNQDSPQPYSRRNKNNNQSSKTALRQIREQRQPQPRRRDASAASVRQTTFASAGHSRLCEPASLSDTPSGRCGLCHRPRTHAANR